MIVRRSKLISKTLYFLHWFALCSKWRRSNDIHEPAEAFSIIVSRERVCWRDGWLMSQNQYPLLKSDNLMSHICQRNGISLNPNSQIYEFVSLGSVVMHPCIRCDMPCKNVSVIKLMNGKMCRERKKTPPTNRLFATY